MSEANESLRQITKFNRSLKVSNNRAAGLLLTFRERFSSSINVGMRSFHSLSPRYIVRRFQRQKNNLPQITTPRIVTFDKGFINQAAKNAPTVKVNLLKI